MDVPAAKPLKSVLFAKLKAGILLSLAQPENIDPADVTFAKLNNGTSCRNGH